MVHGGGVMKAEADLGLIQVLTKVQCSVHSALNSNKSTADQRLGSPDLREHAKCLFTYDLRVKSDKRRATVLNPCSL
jgi:hypothetical protein